MSTNKHHSVYVVELSETVLRDRRFVRKYPGDMPSGKNDLTDKVI